MEWYQVNIDLNKYNTIPKLFWRQVKKFPDKTTIWKKQDGLWKGLTWQQYGKFSKDIGNGLRSEEHTSELQSQ